MTHAPLRPPARPAGLPPGQRLAAYRRLALTVPARGDFQPAAERIIARLPHYCPWIVTAAIRVLTAGGELRRVTPDPVGCFPETVRLGEPPAGWAAERGDLLILPDTAILAELGLPARSLAAAPIQRLDGTIAGTIEARAGAPFGLIDSDGQGLRQLGQAAARLSLPETPTYRPPAHDRSRVQATLSGAGIDLGTGAQPAAFAAFAAQSRARQAESLRDLTAVLGALTRGVAGLPVGQPPPAESPGTAAPGENDQSAEDLLDVWQLVHRELRRVLSQLTDAGLARDRDIEAWIAVLAKLTNPESPATTC